MATARLQLRSKKDTTKETPVYLVVEHKGKELLKYPTGVSVTPKQWNPEKKEVRKVVGVTHGTFNQTFNKLLKVVNKTFAELNAEDLPITGEAIRKALDIVTGKDKKKNFESDFLGFIQSEREKLILKVNTTTHQKLSRATISKYKCLYDVVAEMEKKNRAKLTFDNINMDFYYKFILHLQSKEFMPNTIGSKYVRPLKTMLLEAERQGIKVNNAFRYKEFSEPSEDPFKIYLNESEMKSIIDFDFSQNERLERVRDVFVLGYYTGQRYSDYSKYNAKQFENKCIVLLQQKTAKKVIVPVEKNVMDIMEKYNWVLPTISAQKFNEYLKEVCKAVGICNLISRTHTHGSERETVQYQKWELVSSHTARRSFATNMYVSKKIQAYEIMLVTGHSTEKDFKKYICLTGTENAESFREQMIGKKTPSLLLRVA
jgi:integrase